MRARDYLLSLPERLLRSAIGLGAGVVREVGDVAIPEGVRESRLYQNVVDTTLRFLIEQVGGAKGVYKSDAALTGNFLLRRTAGNAIEALGIVAFRASPVWVLAALADLSGVGRRLIPEIADALKAEGLLKEDAQFTSMEQVLDGLERSSARLAAAVNTPPLDVAGLREEWRALRHDVGSIAPGALPSAETVTDLWADLKRESARQEVSVFTLSSMLALSAVRSVPDTFRRLSASGRLATRRTGQVIAAALLDDYRATLGRIAQVGFVRYAIGQLRPYVRAAWAQFSPEQRTLTERVVHAVADAKVRRRQRQQLDDQGA
jgi:hypothetical protein